MMVSYGIVEEELEALYNSIRDFKAPIHGGYIDFDMPMVYCLHPNFADLNLYTFTNRCRHGMINFYGITLSKTEEDFLTMQKKMKRTDMLIEWPLWKTGWEKSEVERGTLIISHFKDFYNKFS